LKKKKQSLIENEMSHIDLNVHQHRNKDREYWFELNSSTDLNKKLIELTDSKNKSNALIQFNKLNKNILLLFW
jgi:hypothetical protein